MENYSKLIIDTGKTKDGKSFTYDVVSKEFLFESTMKNFDMQIFSSFTPKINCNNDLKSRLENEIYKLILNPGEIRFETSHYSKNRGLRYYSINIKSLETDSNLITGIIYDITNEKSLLSNDFILIE